MKILRIGERLVRAGILTPQQLGIALSEQKRVEGRLEELAVDLGFCSPEQVATAVADMAGVRYAALEGRRIDRPLADLVPEETSREFKLVPIDRKGDTLVVSLADPLNILAVDGLREHTGLDIEVVVSSAREIGDAQDALYRHEKHGDALDDLVEKARKAIVETDDSGEQELRPVIELVEAMLAEGFKRRATDIHVEPEERVLRVRYRVDGMMLPGLTLPNALRPNLTARLKILADLDISESRRPQDGRMRVIVGARVYDLRVSTMPTVHGENTVMRVLDRSNVVRGLDAIGMPTAVIEAFRTLISTQAGMILVTGPTGSGKTTTLYSALTALDASGTKIATLEDPVEYELPMIRQSQVSEKSGFDFASGLRALLRQDPDTIFVGEMRDAETVNIAVRAAMTGHLVLSTLHTTSALGTLPRLAQMGIPADLLITSIRGLLAQRLVRVICGSCVETAAPDPALLQRLGLTGLETGPLKSGRGCDACSGTGYRGRTALYELVRMSTVLGDAFASGASFGELARIAASEGTCFLRDHGLELAVSGRTTLEEVLRATADAPVSLFAEKATREVAGV